MQKTPPVCLAGGPESTAHASPGQTYIPRAPVQGPTPPGALTAPPWTCRTRGPRQRRPQTGVPGMELHASEEAEMAQQQTVQSISPANPLKPQTECEPKIPISTSQQLSSSSAFTSECQKQPIPMVPKQTRRSNERTQGELNLAEAVNHNRMNQAKTGKKLGAEAPQKYYLNVLD